MNVENQNQYNDSYLFPESVIVSNCPLMLMGCLPDEIPKSQTETYRKTVRYYFPHWYVSLKKFPFQNLN